PTWNKTVQVDHGTAVLPQKCTPAVTKTVCDRGSNHLALRIDVNRNTAWITVQGAEIRHHIILPKERDQCFVALISGSPNYFAIFIDPVRRPEGASKCAQILHALRLCPQKGVSSCIAGQVRSTDYLTSIAQPAWGSEGASEAAEVQHFAVLPNKRGDG